MILPFIFLSHAKSLQLIELFFFLNPFSFLSFSFFFTALTSSYYSRCYFSCCWAGAKNRVDIWTICRPPASSSVSTMKRGQCCCERCTRFSIDRRPTSSSKSFSLMISRTWVRDHPFATPWSPLHHYFITTLSSLYHYFITTSSTSTISPFQIYQLQFSSSL